MSVSLGKRQAKIEPNTKPTYLNIKDVGKSLKEMGSDVFKTTHQNVVSQWFHSDLDADLIVWRDENKNIIKQQVNLLGQVVEWNIVDGIRTGFVVETEEQNEVKQTQGSKSRTEIHFDLNPIVDSISQAVELISHSECLTTQDKTTVTDNLKNAPKMDMMHPKEFLKRFGHKKDSSQESNWFQKIVRRLFG